MLSFDATSMSVSVLKDGAPRTTGRSVEITDFQISFESPYEVFSPQLHIWSLSRRMTISRVDGTFRAEPVFRGPDGQQVSVETVEAWRRAAKVSPWVAMIPPPERGVCAKDDRRF
jgi:hypothetical protein